jgi:hypothetical protein
MNNITQTEKKRAWLPRTALIVGVLGFVGLFQLSYLQWLVPFFGYYGFENCNPPGQYLLLAWMLSALPALWMPIRLLRPSQLIYWVLYLTVFVPSMFVPLYMGLVDIPENVSMMLALFLGFLILGIPYRWSLPSVRRLQFSPRTFWTGFTFIVVALELWVLIVFRGNLHIVSFADIYDLRFAANDVMEGSLVGYAIIWLSSIIGPFLMAYGLVNRRKIVCLAGLLAQLLVYSAVGSKAALLSILIVMAFYFLLRDKGGFFGIKAIWGCAVLFFILFLARSTDPGSGSILGWTFSIILMRTFGNSGLSMEWYRDFFQRNPLTYYSHVTGVNWFVHYPYANPIGIEVGGFYSGNPSLDQNANFWATDGLAGGGLLGVVLISLLAAFIFWLLDVAAQKHDLRFSCLLVCFTAINLSNVSLFTTLLSGGLGFLIPILYLMPSETNHEQLWVKGRASPIRGGPSNMPGLSGI